MSTLPIQLRQVSFHYPGAGEPLLREIELDVRAGEFLGIVGPTGSGKTTLLHILCGVIPHYVRGDLTGEVLFYGKSTRTLTLAGITRDIGLVLQDPEAQLFNLLVRDEVIWGLENRGVAREEMKKRLDETLAFFHIEHLRDRVAYDLSGGEKQKVAMAAVCAIRPKVIVFDHPTSQVDPLGAELIIDAINELARSGDHTIIMVEDKVDELANNADRLVLLHEGRLSPAVTPQDFCSNRAALAAAGIQPPQVAELAHQIRAAGVPLSRIPVNLEEAVPLYRDLLLQRKGGERNVG